MNTETLTNIGLTEVQAKIYLYLIKSGKSTPSDIAKNINENRTTVYSAAEKLEKIGLISQKDQGKITAYIPNHPSALETLAEKRLRHAARQAKNLESNLPSLINYYNEHQHQPGVATFYGDEGARIIREKILAEKQTYYFIRSRYDESANKTTLEEFKKARVEANIKSENITPSEFTDRTNQEAAKDLLSRTLLPKGEYDSPVQISVFGDNIAFINYAKGGMSTLIESPEIADAMRQFFLFAKKHIRQSTNQEELDSKITSNRD